MIGLDSNILVQLALEDHPAHRATLSSVQAEIEREARLVFPSFILDEFLHVVTDERRFDPPLKMSEALDFAEELLGNLSVVLLEPDKATQWQTLRWMRQFNLGRKRILDTHLAAALHTAGVRRLLTSNPKDFTVFGVFEIITP